MSSYCITTSILAKIILVRLADVLKMKPEKLNKTKKPKVGDPTSMRILEFTHKELSKPLDALKPKIYDIADSLAADVKSNPSGKFRCLQAPAGGYQVAIETYCGAYVRVMPVYDGLPENLSFRVDISHA